jgi:hypothetical protein
MAVGVAATAVALALLRGDVAAASAAACTDDISCSLNGVCVGATGQCRCDPGWGYARCSTLQLGPAAADNGYRQPARSSWGGSVIQRGGVFHMFVEELVNEW